MKHLLSYILLGTLLVWTSFGCRKDEVTFSDYPSSLGEIDFLFSQIPSSSSTSTFDFKPGGNIIPDTVLTTASGVRVFLVDTDHLFTTETGAPQSLSVCQNVEIKITEIFKKGDLIANGIATTDIQGNFLENSGTFYLTVRCDGRPVQLVTDRYIKIQFPATAQATGMALYYATENPDRIVNQWQSGASNTIFWADWQTNQGLKRGYELLTNRLGWIAVQRAISPDAGAFCVTLPLQFDGSNTRAYLVFSDIKAVKPLEFSSNGKFCTDQVPVGYPLQLVTISKAGPEYWYLQVETESATDASIKATPATRSEMQVFDFIRGL